MAGAPAGSVSTPGVAADDLVESVTRLYCYLFGEPEAEVTAGGGVPVPAMGSRGRSGPASCCPAARCFRWYAPRWSEPTLRCSPPCTTERHRTDEQTRRQPVSASRHMVSGRYRCAVRCGESYRPLPR